MIEILAFLTADSEILAGGVPHPTRHRWSLLDTYLGTEGAGVHSVRASARST